MFDADARHLEHLGRTISILGPQDLQPPRACPWTFRSYPPVLSPRPCLERQHQQPRKNANMVSDFQPFNVVRVCKIMGECWKLTKIYRFHEFHGFRSLEFLKFYIQNIKMGSLKACLHVSSAAGVVFPSGGEGSLREGSKETAWRHCRPTIPCRWWYWRSNTSRKLVNVPKRYIVENKREEEQEAKLRKETNNTKLRTEH